MQTEREKRFLEWISLYVINVGWARYSQFKGWVVTASMSDNQEEMSELFLSLDDEYECGKIGNKITTLAKWYAEDPDPAIAMNQVMNLLRAQHAEIDRKQYGE